MNTHTTPFNELINKLAKDLPPYYIFKICVENGAGWLEIDNYGRTAEVENVYSDHDNSMEEIVIRELNKLTNYRSNEEEI